MLAGDPAEAVDKAEEFLKERALAAYYDEVALKGLKLAQNDIARGSLDSMRIEKVRESVNELVDDLADHEDRTPKQGATKDAEAAAAVATAGEEAGRDLPVLTKEQLAAEWQGETPVLCTAGRSGLDEAAAMMLAQLLLKHGLAARLEHAEALSAPNIYRLDTAGVAMVCLSYLDTTSLAHIRYTIRRLRRKLPNAKILLGFWLGEGDIPALREALKADFVATTFREATKLCLDAARSPAAQSSASPSPEIGKAETPAA
jgi:hypothetical protein